MEQSVKLTFMSGSRDGESIRVAGSGSPLSIVIGRTEPCELVLGDDPDMSRRHARLVLNGTSWMIEDMGSSNGTFVGEFNLERKISTSTLIKEGEIFRVGLTRIKLGGYVADLASAASAAVVNRE